MPQNIKPQDKHKTKTAELSSLYSKWGDVFLKTYETYCDKEPDGQRRHSVTLVALGILGVVAMTWSKVHEGIIYVVLTLIAFVLILTWKRNE